MFDVLGIDDCRAILDLLIRSPEPLTQGKIAEVLDLKSSLASRRLSEVEGAGLAARASSHAPYELHFRDRVLTMLELGADLADEAAVRAAAESKALRDERRRSRMRGGALVGRAQSS